MKKTIIGILFAVCMAICILPFAVSASGESGSAEKYGIKIGYGSGETVITDDNKDDVLCDGGSVKYSYDKSAKKGTLTLNNATLVTDSVFPINAEETDTLEIVLVGDVVLSSEQKPNADVNICFNGKTVSVKKHSLEYSGHMICVDSETPVSVTLTDCIGRSAGADLPFLNRRLFHNRLDKTPEGYYNKTRILTKRRNRADRT